MEVLVAADSAERVPYPSAPPLPGLGSLWLASRAPLSPLPWRAGKLSPSHGPAGGAGGAEHGAG